MYTSTVSDGTMKRGDEPSIADRNRAKFLQSLDKKPNDAVLVQLDYNSDDFCRYTVVDTSAAGEGMTRAGRIADGIATQSVGLALFLPLADCIGAVLYDPDHEVLMLTHLGRHNLEQDGGVKSVEFLVQQFGTNSSRLEVVFSPSAGKENYPLFAFDGKSLADVATAQLMTAGVSRSAIKHSPYDTTTDQNYFSHSEFLKGNRETDGRFAIVAMIDP